MAAACFSRSTYWSSPTLTSTWTIVPPLNRAGDVYSFDTASAEWRPTQRPSPQSVNWASCVRIGPVATASSSTYSVAVPCASPRSPTNSFTDSTPSTCLPGSIVSETNCCSGAMPRKL